MYIRRVGRDSCVIYIAAFTVMKECELIKQVEPVGISLGEEKIHLQGKSVCSR